MSRRNKITVIGAGNVGATTAHWAATRHLGDVVLVDIKEGMPQGKSLDLAESAPAMGFDLKLVGSNDYAATAGSDVVVITAGVPRRKDPKTGEYTSRDELVETNRKIVGAVTKAVAEHSPEAALICVANPLDAMCHVTFHESGFPKERVMGMAGVLDTSRYKTFIAMELGVSVEDIHGMVLGGHGDTMVPLPRHTSVGGIPLTELMPKEKIDAIIQRTRKGGGEIVGLLGYSGYYAPAASACVMVESIVRDRKRVLPVACMCEGEYGYSGLYLGVPAVLGAGGVEKIIEMELNAEEKAMLDVSAKAVEDVVKLLPY
ncbi:malate dehydrogenase [Pseudenhygromyxa sp. WMMC2535]|uniref:malate dehydrogenase n=1 Tax=Pseudenhygromyxa sp. WMMC2535 TaxID=2712867 RepID=UPI001554E752|nr:malate dehydrogenase [Pseudenhygromyxa sp. WMMC2535]NVB42344.1 malate dehydrogenase [Pseudenhygromyxa sp. WMMC2535]